MEIKLIEKRNYIKLKKIKIKNYEDSFTIKI